MITFTVNDETDIMYVDFHPPTNLFPAYYPSSVQIGKVKLKCPKCSESLDIKAYFHKTCLSCFSQGIRSALTGCWNQ